MNRINSVFARLFKPRDYHYCTVCMGMYTPYRNPISHWRDMEMKGPGGRNEKKWGEKKFQLSTSSKSLRPFYLVFSCFSKLGFHNAARKKHRGREEGVVGQYLWFSKPASREDIRSPENEKWWGSFLMGRSTFIIIKKGHRISTGNLKMVGKMAELRYEIKKSRGRAVTRGGIKRISFCRSKSSDWWGGDRLVQKQAKLIKSWKIGQIYSTVETQ